MSSKKEAMLCGILKTLRKNYNRSWNAHYYCLIKIFSDTEQFQFYVWLALNTSYIASFVNYVTFKKKMLINHSIVT